MRVFEFLELPHQPVVVGVAEFRRVLPVVELVGAIDSRPQFAGAARGIGSCLLRHRPRIAT